MLGLLLSLAAVAGTMTVDVLDVGQGDSLLVTSPAGKRVLIDAGTGKHDVAPMLERRGVEKLDLIIATHPHADHIGGMDEVLDAFEVGVYTDNGLPHTTSAYTQVMERVEEKAITYRTALAGQVYNLDDDIKVEILHPQERAMRNTRSDLNSNSVVARITHGDLCFLFTGDAEDPTERILLRKEITSCQVLKVAHHGSSHSSSFFWLQRIKPEIALISAGEGNRYGHPDHETIGRLTKAGASIYRTDLHGAIQVRSTGESIEVLTNVEPAASPVAERAMVGEPVRLTAGPGREAAILRDLNTRSAEELETLPGIGRERGEAIVAWRTKHGDFERLEQLLEIPGTGPGTIAMLRISPMTTESAEAAAVASTPTERSSRGSLGENGGPPRLSQGPLAANRPAGGVIIDVNNANVEALLSLPGIGPQKAKAIVAYRESNGAFGVVEDLDAVPGIGPGTIANIRGRIRFGEAEATQPESP